MSVSPSLAREFHTGVWCHKTKMNPSMYPCLWLSLSLSLSLSNSLSPHSLFPFIIYGISDLNRHLDRVDLNRLVERSNISAIVARSSSGVFDVVLDGARAQLVKADQAFQRLGRCACCQKQPWELPPTPGARLAAAASPFSTDASTPSFPNRSLQLALDAQGRYSGILAQDCCQYN